MSSWLTTSGVGVRMAATTKLMSTAYFRLRRKKGRSTTPTLARKTMSTGSSKTMPKARNRRRASEKYSLTAGMASSRSLE